MTNDEPALIGGIPLRHSSFVISLPSQLAYLFPMPSLGVDLAEEILELKRERNAVILAHNYQVKEIQELADFVSDSLGLSYQAAKTAAEVIAFSGVDVMAEMAQSMQLTKPVEPPDLDAACSL